MTSAELLPAQGILPATTDVLIIGAGPAGLAAAEAAGSARIPASDATMNCQTPCCGRLAPRSDMIGQTATAATTPSTIRLLLNWQPSGDRGGGPCGRSCRLVSSDRITLSDSAPLHVRNQWKGPSSSWTEGPFCSKP